MTAAYLILFGLALALFVMVICPVLLLILCAAVQSRLSGRRLPYPLILPALTGMACLLCGCYAEQSYEWKALLWTVPAVWARMSFVGSMAGWVISRNIALPPRRSRC